jgi:membrane protease YdiL (CAAX protease family)
LLTKITTKQLKPYQGITVFILVILSILFVAAPIQRKWGMYGVALTELIILLLAVIPAIILKINLKEIFPVKKPLLSQILGVLTIWCGSYFAVLLITLVIGYFFPEGLTKVNNGLQNVFTSVPMGVAFLIIAVMPAICEEALHRGLILYSLSSLKSKWMIVLSMGVIFGVFHLDLYRFLPTAVLGMAMTYIMLETRNILLPILFHFINNVLTTYISFTTKSQAALTEINSEMMLSVISTYFMIGAIIPFLILLGVRLIHRKESIEETEDMAVIKKRKNKMLGIAALCSLLMILLGTVTMLLNLNKAPVFETSVSMDVNHKSDNLHMPMKIDKAGDYLLDLDIKSNKGLVDIEIIDESGKVVFQMSCNKATSTGPIKLEKTSYTINVNFLMDMNEVEEYYAEKGIKYNVDLKEKLNLDGDLEELSNFRMKILIK